MAVRLALQGGLKDFARGIEYNAATDTYAPTTDRQLAPLFEAIFAGLRTSELGTTIREESAVLQLIRTANDNHRVGERVAA